MLDTDHSITMDATDTLAPNLDEVKSILEAILFAASEPISLEQFSQLFDDVSVRQIRQQLMRLRDEYQETNRSFQLIEIANGFQICTDRAYHQWIEKFHTRQVRVKLSPSALEALAIVAYKQPVTRSEVEEIRGVNSDSVLSSLIEKRMLRIAGRKPGPGRSLLLATTDEFLEQFGLKDLSTLPSMEEIEEILNQTGAE
jgi:segregation and condensation protein B